MAASQNDHSIKRKIQAMKEVILGQSNNDLLLVLQYYDENVERAIQAYIEDGAKEALTQWQHSSSKAVAKRKRRNKPKSAATNDQTGQSGASNNVEDIKTDQSQTVAHKLSNHVQSNGPTSTLPLRKPSANQDVQVDKVTNNALVNDKINKIPDKVETISDKAATAVDRSAHAVKLVETTNEKLELSNCNEIIKSTRVDVNNVDKTDNSTLKRDFVNQSDRESRHSFHQSDSKNINSNFVPDNHKNRSNEATTFGVGNKQGHSDKERVPSAAAASARTYHATSAAASVRTYPASQHAKPPNSASTNQFTPRGGKQGEKQQKRPDRKKSNSLHPEKPASRMTQRERERTISSSSTGATGQTIERLVKDLQRQTSSFERLRLLLTEELSKSHKRIRTVFNGVRNCLDKREEELLGELEQVEIKANDAMDYRQDLAEQLRLRSVRAADKGSADFRAEVKQFIMEKRIDEDLCRSLRFLYNADTAKKKKVPTATLR